MEHTTDWEVAMAVIHFRLNRADAHIPTIARGSKLSPATVRRWKKEPPKKRPGLPQFIALARYFDMTVRFEGL